MQIQNPRTAGTVTGAYMEALGKLYGAKNHSTTTAPLKRRLPPFGKGIKDRIGSLPPCDRTIWVYSGDRHAWDLARVRSALKLPVLVLPPGEDPRLYVWPVHGCEVIVTDIGGSVDGALLTLASELLQSGASVVRIVNGTKPSLAVFRREAIHAA